MEENKEIDLLQIASALLKRWWIFVLSAVIGGASFFSYTYYNVKPTYTASALFYVNSSKINLSSGTISISGSDISTARTLVDTYRVILNSRLCLEEVKKTANLDYSYDQLSRMIVASSVNNTEIFSVTVTTNDPDEACNIANTVANVLPQKVSSVIEGTRVSVVDYAVRPTSSNGPSYRNKALLGALIGVIISAAVVILIELLNDSVQSEDWLIEAFGDDIPLLAVVPDASTKSGKRYGRYKKYNSYYSDYALSPKNESGKGDK